jgi:hypothetical protein
VSEAQAAPISTLSAFGIGQRFFQAAPDALSRFAHHRVLLALRSTNGADQLAEVPPNGRRSRIIKVLPLKRSEMRNPLHSLRHFSILKIAGARCPKSL